MAMASLTSSLLARKGQARPSSHNITTEFRFKNDDAVELLMDSQREQAAKGHAQKVFTADIEATPVVEKEKPEQKSSSVEAKPEQKTAAPVPAVQKAAVAEVNKPKRPALPPSNPEDVARKTVRIRSDLDVILRLFAARNQLSQKEIIEAALVDYLQDQRVDMSCICGAQD